MPDYCCAMRRRFVLGIVAENVDSPEPIDLCDFLDWDQKTPAGQRPIIHIRFCPFCGQRVDGQQKRAPEA